MDGLREYTIKNRTKDVMNTPDADQYIHKECRIYTCTYIRLL